MGRNLPRYRYDGSLSPIDFVNDNGVWMPITYRFHPRTALLRGGWLAFDEMMTCAVPIHLDPGDPMYVMRFAGDQRLACYPVNVNSVPVRLNPAGQAIYEEAWDGADLVIMNGGHVLGVHILLKDDHPPGFQFRYNVQFNGVARDGYIYLGGRGWPAKGGMRIPRPVLKPPVNPDPIPEDENPRPIVLRWVMIDPSTIRVVLPQGDFSGWILDPTFETQPDASLGIDCYMDEANSATNYNGADMDVGHDAAGNNRDGIMKFDLSGIPAGSEINTWDFQFYRYAGSGGDGAYWMVAFLAASDGWSETGSCWDNKDGVNDWPGGPTGFGDGPADRPGVAVEANANKWYEHPGGAVAWPAWYHFSSPLWGPFAGDTVRLAAIQAMFDDYYGWMIVDWNRGATGANRHYNFYTSDEVGNPTLRPILTVEYTPPPAKRLAYYTFNLWDPEGAILDAKGHKVEPNDLRADRYMDVQGLDLPSAKQYPDMVEDPTKTRLMQVQANETGARIVPNPNDFADVLIRRAGAGI